MLLGSGVRASAALGWAEGGGAMAEGQPALERQIAAVDTARARSASRKASSKKKKKPPAGGGARGSRMGEGRLSTEMAVSGSGGGLHPTVYYTSTEPGRIDVDLAGAAALEALPKIGPVMARRIVTDRDSLGPFGSLEELQRVKGIGPALARAIAPYVTFSLRPRQSRVKEPARKTGRTRARRRAPSHP